MKFGMRRLGMLLADAGWAFARAFCEASDQGLTAETTDKFGTSLAGLGGIWLANRGGSYNATDCTDEPYFANPLPSGLRLTFSGAAQAYGMRELRERYPDLSDAERQKLLGWVLQWLSDLLWNERKEQEKERERAIARMLDAKRRHTSRQGKKVSRRTKGTKVSLKMKAAAAETAKPVVPWRLRLERVRGTTGFDGLERITSASLMDLLEIEQRDRKAGAYRRLARVMTERQFASGTLIAAASGSSAAGTFAAGPPAVVGRADSQGVPVAR